MSSAGGQAPKPWQVYLPMSKVALAAMIMNAVRDRSLRRVEIRADAQLGWVAIPNPDGEVSAELSERVEAVASSLRDLYRLPSQRKMIKV